MFIAKNNDLIILAKETIEELEQALQFMVYDEIVETEEDYELYNGEYLTVEEITQKEQERISSITMQRWEVFDALIKARMLNEASLKEMIEAEMPETTDEQKIKKMQALNSLANATVFHRGHELVNEIGTELEITKDNLDNFFKTKDYHYLEESAQPDQAEYDQEEGEQEEPEPDEE